MKTITLALAFALASTSLVAGAQEKKANPITQDMKGMFDRVSKFIVASVDAMPDKDFEFKPTKEVRSFAQLLGHVADASYMFCGLAKGEKPAQKNIEKTVTTKAAMKKALEDAFAYCDAVYAATADSSLQQPVEMFGGKQSKFFALDLNIAHDNEHYGNLVTYLRLKNVTPPSSQEHR